MTPYYADEAVTLYHGDCREITEWLAADVQVDPPYGIGLHADHQPLIAGDNDTTARDVALAAWGSRPALVFGAWRVARPASVRQRIVWDKRGGNGYKFGDVNMPWAEVTEEIYVIGGGWVGRRRPNIIAAPTYNSMARDRPPHPAPKPVALMSALIECCPPGVIADPFAGSGSTLVAARNLGRKAIGVEIEERYCEVIARRLSQAALPLHAGDPS